MVDLFMLDMLQGDRWRRCSVSGNASSEKAGIQHAAENETARYPTGD
jgi:hypothetical protein